MSDEYQRIEVITGTLRRRRWTAEQKLRIVEDGFESGESLSAVARRHGVAANLLYRWRRLVAEGGAVAVSADESVVSTSEVRRLEDRVRELERLLGRKTMEVEILKEALERSRSKTELAQRLAAEGRYPVKRIAATLGVSRSHLHERLRTDAKPRWRYHKAQDAALLSVIRRLVDTRPTYGYRRITALLNRELAKLSQPRTNHKRIYRIMRRHGLLLARHSGARPGRIHDGKIVVMRSKSALVLGCSGALVLERRDDPHRLRHRCA